jgi:hypothetical protein
VREREKWPTPDKSRGHHREFALLLPNLGIQFHLPYMPIPPAVSARTCDEWVERGLLDSNWVQIDPDGPGYGWGEFLVWCDLTDPANALTIVRTPLPH